MNQLYLLDENVLIDAKRDYYPFDAVPEFWDWLQHQGDNGRVKIPPEIWDGPRQGNDELADWLKEDRTEETLLLDEQADVAKVRRVLAAYATDLTDVEVASIGNDAFLIAYALDSNRIVVTTEGTKRSQVRSNRRIPDVCSDLGIKCINTFRLIKELDFNTRWK